MAGKIYKNDVGTEILVNMGESITGATGLNFAVKKPDGSTVNWVPTIVNTDFLTYIVLSGDLNLVGDYHVQPQLTISGWTGCGDTVRFSVHEKFN